MNSNTLNSHAYVMDLPHGMNALRLLDDHAINHTAGILQISTKKWQNIAPNNRGQFYSLYSNDNYPHVLIWVQDNAVRLCRAINNARPVKYTSQIVTFIVSQQFDIAADMGCRSIFG